jgi:hypothetical protein
VTDAVLMGKQIKSVTSEVEGQQQSHQARYPNREGFTNIGCVIAWDEDGEVDRCVSVLFLVLSSCDSIVEAS